jgi:hypothetical protein
MAGILSRSPIAHPHGASRHSRILHQAHDNHACDVNAHVMRRLGVSRRDLFDSIERSALRALPAQDYEYAEWRLARVGLDHIPSSHRRYAEWTPDRFRRGRGPSARTPTLFDHPNVRGGLRRQTRQWTHCAV